MAIARADAARRMTTDGLKIRVCPECGKWTLCRFEWAHTALPEGVWYWRCAQPGGCWAGPFVMEAM